MVNLPAPLEEGQNDPSQKEQWNVLRCSVCVLVIRNRGRCTGWGWGWDSWLCIYIIAGHVNTRCHVQEMQVKIWLDLSRRAWGQKICIHSILLRAHCILKPWLTCLEISHTRYILNLDVFRKAFFSNERRSNVYIDLGDANCQLLSSHAILNIGCLYLLEPGIISPPAFKLIIM